jgi:hypothetical protein
VAAAIVIAAVAAPTVALARPVDPGPGYTLSAEQPLTAPVHGALAPSGVHPATPSVAASSSAFQWADAAIGAGSLLVLIGVGGAAAAVYRHRTHPLAS